MGCESCLPQMPRSAFRLLFSEFGECEMGLAALAQRADLDDGGSDQRVPEGDTPIVCVDGDQALRFRLSRGAQALHASVAIWRTARSPVPSSARSSRSRRHAVGRSLMRET